MNLEINIQNAWLCLTTLCALAGVEWLFGSSAIARNTFKKCISSRTINHNVVL